MKVCNTNITSTNIHKSHQGCITSIGLRMKKIDEDENPMYIHLKIKITFQDINSLFIH